MADSSQELLRSDDNALIKTIQATHGIDNFTFNMKPLLSVIEDIMSLTHNREDIPDSRDTRIAFSDDISQIAMKSRLDDLVLKINHISWEILGNISGGENVQEAVMDILKALSSFFWAGKGVVALAAFAVNYGEFWLVKELHSTNPVAESLALLEQLPTEMERSSTIFQGMANLIKAVLFLTKCICESVDLQGRKYLTPDMPVVKNMIVQIPEYTYWIIRSIVTCQSQLSNLKSESFGSEASNVSILVDKVRELGKSMRTQLDLCYQQAEEKRIEEIYTKLKTLNDITSNKDNVRILKALVSEEEETPLYDGHTKTQVRIDMDTLGKKILLLYLSEPKFLTLEVQFLSEMYLESGQKPPDYEIVWFPMAQGTSSMSQEQKQMYKDMQNRMPWLSFRDISLLDPAVVKYMKEEWQFEKKSMIKVLDQKGRLIKNHDAMQMILIWGSLASPFNGKREEALWADAKWGVDFMLNFIEPSAINWAREGKFICMFGSEDIEWIQQFTTSISAITTQAQMPLMMLYMGTTKTNEMNQQMNEIVSARNLSDKIIDPMKISLFWQRFFAIWLSRVQIGMSPESDGIITEAFQMGSLECSNRGWVIISEGSEKMVKAMGDTMLKALNEYEQWKSNVGAMGFVEALDQHIGSIGGTRGVCNICVLLKTKNGVPERMNCIECRREMSMAVRFRCCGD